RRTPGARRDSIPRTRRCDARMFLSLSSAVWSELWALACRLTGLRVLGVDPPRQPLLDAQRIERTLLAAGALLHRGKASPEALVGGVQRALRLQTEPPPHNRERKQQITQLRLRRVLVVTCSRRGQLTRLLGHLLQRAQVGGPVEARLGGLPAQLVGLVEGWRALGNAAQAALGGDLLATRGALGLLQRLPVAQHLRRVVRRHLAEDVRMPPDQLLSDDLKNVADVKQVLVVRHLRLKVDLEQQVT